MEAQNNFSLRLLWPIKWGAFGIASLVNVFPILTIFYLIIWNSESMSWITRGVFLILMALSMKGLNCANILKEKAQIYDFMMAIFFCFAIIGYIRSDYLELGFLYFLCLNLCVFFLGRFSNREENYPLFAYLFAYGLFVSLVFLFSLPETFNQWENGGAKHPMLYGVINTAGGLDVTLGSLAVLAGSAICLDYFSQTQPIRWLMHACVALSMFLLILIASKSVIISVVASLIVLIAAQKRRWRNALSLLVAFSIGLVVALVVAPENNIQYYNLVSPNALIEYFKVYTSSSGIPQEIPETADTGVIRMHLTLDALNKIIDRPWLGIGAKIWTYNSPHPHNIFIESALIFGIPSFCVLVAFYVMALWRLLIRSVDKKQDVLIGALLLFFIFYNCIQGQLASFRSLPLFLLSGYAASMITRQREFVTFGKK